MKKMQGYKKMLIKKWIHTISSESMGFFNWEGVLGSYWYGVK